MTLPWESANRLKEQQAKSSKASGRLGSLGLMIGLDSLEGLFQPKYDSILFF